MKTVSSDAALKILEIVTDRVGRQIKITENNIHYAMESVIVHMEELADCPSDLVGEKLLEVATSCIIAVASMVAGTDDIAEVVKPVDRAELARQKMIDRVMKANESHIVPTDRLE